MNDNGRLMQAATWAAVGVAVVLIVVKLFAWYVTGSVAVLSSLLDSLLDAAASLVNLVAVRQALVPPDAQHRFGHGKAEPLASLAQAAFISGSALLLLSEAVNRLIAPQPPARSEIGVVVMAFSMVMTAALVLFQRHVIRRTGSVAISADSLHYASDFVVNASVIVSLLLASWLGWTLVDPLCGIAIGVYIAYSAFRIARTALDLLMDHELPDADRARIVTIARAHPQVRDVHDLRTRSAGQQIFIQLHLELARDISLKRAHVVSDAVEHELLAAFPNAEVIIHQDPEGVEEARPAIP